MSRTNDNWERLVRATLLREELRWIARQDSLSSSSLSSFASSFHRFANLGTSFTRLQITQATRNLNDRNLIKRGHSGDLYRGFFQQPKIARFFQQSKIAPSVVVIKRIDLRLVEWDVVYKELEFFSSNCNQKLFVPLLGYCSEDDDEKFLVYRYLPYRALSDSLFRTVKKPDSDDDSLQSLDWITRLKIARGAAESLTYLHNECSPPLVHGDVQASSILLDNHFDVRLGSLNQVSAQERTLPSALGAPKGSRAYGVYCFGKVLLELVTGDLGISSYTDAVLGEWLEGSLPYINVHDKELISKIVDPTLIADEDLWEEVWAMAIVAQACLAPRPSRRPTMRYILEALENPVKVVRNVD